MGERVLTLDERTWKWVGEDDVPPESPTQLPVLVKEGVGGHDLWMVWCVGGSWRYWVGDRDRERPIKGYKHFLINGWYSGAPRCRPREAVQGVLRVVRRRLRGEIRSFEKQARQHRKLLAALEVGDE